MKTEAQLWEAIHCLEFLVEKDVHTAATLNTLHALQWMAGEETVGAAVIDATIGAMRDGAT